MSGIAELAARLRIPLLAAPMSSVSGIELVAACSRAGVVGSFPTHNAPRGQLVRWFDEIRTRTADAPDPAPFAANLVVHRSNARLKADLRDLVAARAEIVITSVGSPLAVIRPLQEAGALVLTDVASLRHAELCASAGADGLVLLTAGAGGQTGWANPLAFVRAVRERTDLPLILAGGVGDGAALWAARVLGCELAYMGTRLIATTQSAADENYKRVLLAATIDDIVLTAEVSGLPASFVRPQLSRELTGIEPVAPPPPGDGGAFAFDATRVEGTSWHGAGHSVTAVSEIADVATLVDRIACEYEQARERTASLCSTRDIQLEGPAS